VWAEGQWVTETGAAEGVQGKAAVGFVIAAASAQELSQTRPRVLCGFPVVPYTQGVLENGLKPVRQRDYARVDTLTQPSCCCLTLLKARFSFRSLPAGAGLGCPR